MLRYLLHRQIPQSLLEECLQETTPPLYPAAESGTELRHILQLMHWKRHQ